MLFHLSSCVGILTFFVTISYGSHFRGSMISWRVTNQSSSPLVVEILQRHAWRYNYYDKPLCSSASIPTGKPLLGNYSYQLLCVQSCPTNLTKLGSVQVPCTSFHIGEQYAMGEGRFNIRVRENVTFVSTFNGSAWFDLVTGDDLDWSVAVRIQTFRRLDTGRYNNAPIITMLPIYRLRNLVNYSIKINVADNDYDPYFCLWSVGKIQAGNLSNSVPGGIIDHYGCYLNFTPKKVGYYAVAITVEDFLVLPTNVSATNYLSQVPIQFVLRVYNSTNPCARGPIYIGDLSADTCIYMSPGMTETVRIRLRVQCNNTNVSSIISVNPTGLLISPIQEDPFNEDIFMFMASFTPNAQQVGQNLFCFSGVDSIGNQGDSACLRFAVETETSSLQPLYMSNATRYPIGTVSKTTSLWTILTGSRSYSRPTVEAYVRFRTRFNHSDFYVLNVVTAKDRVLYLSDRIIINTSVTWISNEFYYIYMDAGSTTTTTASSTTKTRAIPTRRTFETTITTNTQTTTTVTFLTTTTTREYLSTSHTTSASFPVGGIVGLTLGSLILCFLFSFLVLSIVRICLIRTFLLRTGVRQQFLSQRVFSRLDSTSSSNTVATHYKLSVQNRQQRESKQQLILNR